MSDEWSAIDVNERGSLTAVSTVDDKTIVRLVADPTTGALVVTTGGSSTGYQQPTGTVNGVNQIFTFAIAPLVICVDQGRTMQKTSSDGTVNWTGTDVVTLTIAPNFDIFGID